MPDPTAGETTASETANTVRMRGTFWSTSEPSIRSPGYLELIKRKRPWVTVSPALFSAYELVETGRSADGSVALSGERPSNPGPITVQGNLDDGSPVTLLEAISRHWHGGIARETQEQRLASAYALIGAHLDDIRYQFTGLKVRLQTFTNPIDVTSPPTQLSNGGNVGWEKSPEGAWLVLTNLPPTSLRVLDRSYLQPLISLLQLATAEPAGLMDYAVQNHPQAPWWPVHSGSQHAQDLKLPAQTLLTPHDLPIAVIKAWLDRVEALGPLPAGVASVITTPPALETQILMLATISEGLHRRLFPDSKGLPAGIAYEVREAATQATKEIHKASAETVNGHLTHLDEPSYGRRLKELAAHAESLVPGITGTSNKWKSLIYDARNDFAHHATTGWMEESDIDRYLTAALSLRWVLRAILLDQADLDHTLLSERFAHHQEYELFLEHARNWQPSVYPSDPKSAAY